VACTTITTALARITRRKPAPTRPVPRIDDRYDLIAAVALPDKSAELLEAIIGFTSEDIFRGKLHVAETNAILLALLDEPELTRAHLRAMAMTYNLLGRGSSLRDLTTAICGHALADPEILTVALWNADPAALRDVAAAAPTILPAAICWVRARWPGVKFAGDDQHQLVAATAYRWERWANLGVGRAAFLRSSSFAFISEDDMFAAGAAITAPATGPGRAAH